MNEILDTYHHRRLQSSAQQQPNNTQQASNFQQTSLGVSHYSLQSLPQSENNFNANHISREAATDLLLSQLASITPIKDNSTQVSRTLFNQSAGKRSPNLKQDASSFLEFEKTQTKDSPLQTQQFSTTPRLSDFNQIFKNYPKAQKARKQQYKQTLSQECRVQKKKVAKKSKEIFQKIKSEEAKIFLRHLKAKRNHSKVKSIRFKVFNTQHTLKNHLYHNRHRENVIKSDSINETIPNKFEDKQAREQEQKQEQIQDQTITDSEPIQYQTSITSQKHEESSNLECRELSMINPGSDLYSHIRQPSRQPSLESNRSGQSSNGSEESQLFRIFSGLRVISVNINQQSDNPNGQQTVGN